MLSLLTDSVEVRKSQFKTKLLIPCGKDYFKIMRTKIKTGEDKKLKFRVKKFIMTNIVENIKSIFEFVSSKTQ